MRFSSWSVMRQNGAWYAAGRYKDAQGKWRRKTHKLDARTKTEAKRLAQDWVTQQRDEDPPACQTPFPRYVEELNRAVAASGSLEEATLSGREASLVHIRDGFDGVTLERVTHGMAQDWVAGMVAAGLSPSTVRKAYHLACESCREAVKAGDLKANPFADVRTPKVVSKPPNALDAEARERLVTWVESADECRLSLAVLLALYGGMRQGEICGLRWGDVNLDAGTLWVRRSIGRGRTGTYVKEPKTGKARDIPLGHTLSRHLTCWNESFRQECVRADVRFDPAGLYVIGTVGGEYYNPGILSREWRTVAVMMNLVGTEGRRCTFHDLRHTFATAAIAAGVDVKTVSSILGHANAAMTLNVYASADPEAKRNAAPAIDRAVMAREA